MNSTIFYSFLLILLIEFDLHDLNGCIDLNILKSTQISEKFLHCGAHGPTGQCSPHSSAVSRRQVLEEPVPDVATRVQGGLLLISTHLRRLSASHLSIATI